jgi:hypothetical protein
VFCVSRSVNELRGGSGSRVCRDPRHSDILREVTRCRQSDVSGTSATCASASASHATGTESSTPRWALPDMIAVSKLEAIRSTNSGWCSRSPALAFEGRSAWSRPLRRVPRQTGHESSVKAGPRRYRRIRYI